MRFNIEEKEARKMLEELGAEPEMIDNFINSLPKTDEEEEAQIREMEKNGLYLMELQKRWDGEEDPFKKSAIAAQKISLSLE